MKILSLLAVLLAGLSCSLFADTPYLRVDCNFADPDSQFLVQGRVLNTTKIRAYTWQGTNVFDASDYNAYFSFGKDYNVTSMIICTGVVYSTYIEFPITSNNFARPVKDWYASVMLTKPSDGSVHSMAYGALTIKAAPEVNASGTFFYQSAINGSAYGPFTGSFTNWPFILTGGLVGGYVEVVTFNASNSALQTQITTNLATQTSTNSVLQSQITVNLTNQTATNLVLQNQITANLTNQNATNTAFSVSAQSAIDTQSDTNAVLQSQITNNLANQNATNVVFQAFLDSVETTNSNYESRIGSNETFRITTQPATNAALQSQITANLTNQIATNISQAATNVLLQSQITNNLALQTLTNESHEVRITSNEVFRITTQPATNVALQLQITNNFATQAASNAAFQSQITDNLTNQNATNTVIQSQVTNNFVNQNATNAALQLQITNNLAAQESTNTSFGVRITSNETFRITTQPATNAALLAQAAYGIISYGWSNHANFGYLTSAENIFAALYAADRSQLDADITGLTQGVYTGSLTSISYTGAVALVSGKSYLYGYSKIGADGTSTLSIAGSTLGPHTAVNNYSNYFTFEDTGTNLVLKLDGTGLAQCNASNIYVKAITGGAVNAAGNMNVGGVIRAYGAVMTNPAAHIAQTTNAHGGIVADTDSRLSDSRDPNAHDQDWSTITNHPLVDQAIIDASAGTNFIGTNTLQSQIDAKVGTNDAAYTNAVALSGSALQSGADGTWTNLSEYNNDLGGLSTNLSDFNNDVGFLTNEPAFTNWLNTNTMQTQIDALGTQKLDKTEAATTYATTGAVGAIDIRVTAVETGKVDRADTNGWEVGSHAAMVLTNTPDYTDTVAKASAAYPASNPSNFISSVGVISHTNLTELNNDTNYLHSSAAEKAHAAAAITNETYVGTVTGGTVTAGAADTFVVTGPNAAITWNTNAAGGEGGAGNITNLLSTDSSVVITSPAGPQPDLSVTNYVAGRIVTRVATNDPNYLAIETNRIALHSESNVIMRVDGTNVYFGAPDLATKAVVTIVSNAFKANDTIVSNAAIAYADSVGTTVSNAYTNTAVLAAAALPKAGGVLTGGIGLGGYYITNAARVYLNTLDYIYTDGTNLLWSDN